MSDTIYRRRYKCPHCGHKGRSKNKGRSERIATCGLCLEKFYLQEQTDDGVYSLPCETIEKMEYMI